jgi:hypothetical protein
LKTIFHVRTRFKTLEMILKCICHECMMKILFLKIWDVTAAARKVGKPGTP